MGNKSRILWLTLASAAILAACSQQEVNEVVKDEVIVSEEIESEIKIQDVTEQLSEIETVETQTESTTEETLQPVSIYYGSGTTMGLKTEEISISEVTPMTILGLLARHNIVSIDTKVQKFEEKTENGKKVLYLDLSKQFKDYVNMMGKDGEYIVIAGLTDTFLSAYGADEMVLTVNDVPLSTNNNKYEGALFFYPLTEQEQEDSTYTLKEEVIQDENVEIRFPQFQNMRNEKTMSLWNESIKEAAISNYKEAGILEYTLDYEIATQNAGMVSIVLRGNCNYAGAAYPYAFESTFNFDLSTGKNLRLKEYRDVDELADYLENGYGYHILRTDVADEDLHQYLAEDFTEDYVTLLDNYDYDISNSNLIPTGYSYIKDDQTLVLVLEVNHAMGDYLEVEIE
ncbi:MAG: hypothetical protein PHE02_04735 [Lachnospiraceae bacterium]|nr:hypothetical protein [Lachnospiraceae bacterium]